MRVHGMHILCPPKKYGNISGSCLRAILGDICCSNIGQSDGIPAGNLKTCLEKLNTSLKVLQDVVDSKQYPYSRAPMCPLTLPFTTSLQNYQLSWLWLCMWSYYGVKCSKGLFDNFCGVPIIVVTGVWYQ